ncbi:LLM class flavin-dependent oxidoreductase [Gordonia humi]|uniref:Alkanesulfonate monooxygenase n=1 Tax=Gordonia humi TaxID=686429 RepID=A0A840ERD6_9ACTN|nr:LLM class flavin-dependent oxidoreductase [Gordonia humi]MBB4135405.1 alkanesulfonate monooxygenase [Gordonia humi]
MSSQFLWYIPNEVSPGHRGDDAVGDHNSLEALSAHAVALEDHGWSGALIGTGWGRPDTFTVAASLAARTTTFQPLVAIRPGYWRPANFASAAATLDHLSGGRLRINIVSGKDDLAAYGDADAAQADRYDRTREFIELTRKLWTQEDVTYRGEHFEVENSTVVPRIEQRGDRVHPTIYFGGASAAAEKVAAQQADVQLFWGEPLDDVAERIDRLKSLEATQCRDLPPLEFGLRVTTVVRDTSEQAWADAQARVAAMAENAARSDRPARVGDNPHRRRAVGQQRLYDLSARGDVLDDNLYTAPARVGGGGAGSTWIVGSAAEVAKTLKRYEDLGISHFVLSDTPYRREIERQGRDLLPLLKG